MRLIEADQLSLCPEELNEDNLGQSAILSHTWEEGELAFSNLDVKYVYGPTTVDQPCGDYRDTAGYQKLSAFANVAKEHGMSRIWMDTCCIDKTSSTELQQSLNSMYRWYKTAETCVFYLSEFEFEVKNGIPSSDWEKKFKACRWFYRGWTLQELIAAKPRRRYFCDKHWRPINTPQGPVTDEHIHRIIHEQTTIPLEVLDGTKPLEQINIASKMRWTANRNTSRAEDIAYSLMGLFDIQMTLQYGEGKEKAFIRLQRKLLKQTGDQSIFAWAHPQPHVRPGLLAPYPECFDIPDMDHDKMEVHQLGPSDDVSTWAITNQGLELTLHVIDEGNRPYEKLCAFLEIMDTKTKKIPTFELYQLRGQKYIRGAGLKLREASEQLTIQRRDVIIPFTAIIPRMKIMPPISVFLPPSNFLDAFNTKLDNHLDCTWLQETDQDGLQQLTCRYPVEESGFYVASAKISIFRKPLEGNSDIKTAGSQDVEQVLYLHCWLE